MTTTLSMPEITLTIEALLAHRAARSAEARRNGSIYVDHGHTANAIAKLRAAYATAPV